MSSAKFVAMKQDNNEEEEPKFKTSSRDTSRNPCGLEEISPKNSSSIHEDWLGEEEEVDFDDKEDKRAETSSVSPMELEKPTCLGQSELASEVADDDDGFRTPTSAEHKIPLITQCPPAPKKRRRNQSPTTLEIKLSPRIRRTLHFDLSIFPPTIQDDDIDSKMKKVRIDHDPE